MLPAHAAANCASADAPSRARGSAGLVAVAHGQRQQAVVAQCVVIAQSLWPSEIPNIRCVISVCTKRWQRTGLR